MKNNFIPFNLCLQLKQLGFNEQCFGVYINGHFEPRYKSKNSTFKPNVKMDKQNQEYCTAVLWQQGISWLLKELDFYIPEIQFIIYSDYSGRWYTCDYINTPIDLDFNNLSEAIEIGINLLKQNKNEMSKLWKRA